VHTARELIIIRINRLRRRNMNCEYGIDFVREA
jgi:hypothetical protein